MTFTPDAQVAAVLAAAIEQNGPPPALRVGDVASRRVALDAMLGYFNNEAQLVASKVDISDHSVVASDGATLLAGAAILSGARKAPAVARQLLIYPMLDDRTTPPSGRLAATRRHDNREDCRCPAGLSSSTRATSMSSVPKPWASRRHLRRRAAPASSHRRRPQRAA